MDPRDLQNIIILYCDYIMQHAHKKTKKTYPSQAAATRLTLYYCFPCVQNHAPVTKIPTRRTNATGRDSRADRTAPISKRFLLPNITYILIIYSGPVARTVPIKNHGQDSHTSHLESIRFKYLRLKQHLKELRTCPECKNRYAKYTCIKALSHGAIFLAICNAILLLVDVKIGKYTFPPQFANIFLTYQTFGTNLHLVRVRLRCTLPGKLHRVTGPLAHHVVLNRTFELLDSINKWNYKQM